MNHMSEVAKMLGVELGEKFIFIDSKDGKIMGVAEINDDRLTLIEYYDVNYTDSWHKHTLENLLTGRYIIQRKPWKPSFGDAYYFVDQSGNVYRYYYHKTLEDIIFYKLGNCYASEEEAKANRDKWIRFYESEDLLEV